MASYQDIEVRLSVVEDKLDFLMRSMNFPVKVGTIQPRVINGTLHQWYQIAKSQGWVKGMDPSSRTIDVDVVESEVVASPPEAPVSTPVEAPANG